jgi:hypothetical protein
MLAEVACTMIELVVQALSVQRLGVDVKVILTTPCIFCIEPLMKYTGWC